MLLERQLTADPSLADLPIRAAAAGGQPDWPQNGGVPSHAMHHLAANDSSDARLARLDSAAGRAATSQLLARPVVAAGRVFTMDAEGAISAFDVASGQRAVGRSSRPTSMPDDGLLGGGLAYDSGWLFASHEHGRGAGHQRDQRHRDLAPDAGPAAARRADGRRRPRAGGDSADNQLYALDGQSGRPIWRHAGFFEGTGLLGGPSPAVEDGVVVVPYSSAEVFGAPARQRSPAVERHRRSARAAPRRWPRSTTSTACR